MPVFDDVATPDARTQAKRKTAATAAAVISAAIVLSAFSAAGIPSVRAEAPGVVAAARHPDLPAPGRNLRSLSATSISGQRHSPGNIGKLAGADAFPVSKKDPLGFAMMMARVREFERLAEVERRREIRKAKAAEKRALAKKRAAAKRKAEAKKLAAEKKRVAVEKKRVAVEKRKQSEIEQRSSAARERGGLVVGDSVALGAEPCLAKHGFEVDAVQSRSFGAGLNALRKKSRASLPANVVIHLGTNGPFSASDFHAVMSHIGGDRHVTWVTIALPDRARYGFESSLNRLIKNLAGSYNNTSIADWNKTSQGMQHWFHDDQIHINSQGCAGFANAVDAARR